MSTLTLGKKIRNLRALKGLTQPELAEQSGVNQSYLSKIENDNVVPSDEILEKIAMAFEVNIAQLFVDLDADFISRYYSHVPGLLNGIDNCKIQAKKLHTICVVIISSFLVIGIFLTIAGQSGLFFSEQAYNYRANIELHYETTKISTITGEEVPWTKKKTGADLFYTFTNLGETYKTEKNQKPILYRMYKKTQINRRGNDVISGVGIILSVFGLIGLCLLLWFGSNTMIAALLTGSKKAKANQHKIISFVRLYALSIMLLIVSICGVISANITYTYTSNGELSLPDLTDTQNQIVLTTHSYKGEFFANEITPESKFQRIYKLESIKQELNTLNSIILMVSVLLLIFAVANTILWVQAYRKRLTYKK